MKASALYNKYSKADLLALARDIEAQPENRAPEGSLYRFNEPTRKKLQAIDQAITWHLADERAARGQPVPTCGYSGRKSNRRR